MLWNEVNKVNKQINKECNKCFDIMALLIK